MSTHGGESPIWAPNGRELFYRNGRAMLSIPMDTTGTKLAFGSPRVLFEGSPVAEGSDPPDGRNYALAPDGARFLMMKEEPQPAQPVVVLNWIQELRRPARTR